MSNLPIKHLSTEISSGVISDNTTNALNKFVIKQVVNSPYIIENNAITNTFFDADGNNMAKPTNNTNQPITPVTTISLSDTYKKLYGHSIKETTSSNNCKCYQIIDNKTDQKHLLNKIISESNNKLLIDSNLVDISYSYDNNNVLETFLASINTYLETSYTNLDNFNKSDFKAKDCVSDNSYSDAESVKV